MLVLVSKLPGLAEFPIVVPSLRFLVLSFQILYRHENFLWEWTVTTPILGMSTTTYKTIMIPELKRHMGKHADDNCDNCEGHVICCLINVNM